MSDRGRVWLLSPSGSRRPKQVLVDNLLHVRSRKDAAAQLVGLHDGDRLSAEGGGGQEEHRQHEKCSWAFHYAEQGLHGLLQRLSRKKAKAMQEPGKSQDTSKSKFLRKILFDNELSFPRSRGKSLDKRRVADSI